MEGECSLHPNDSSLRECVKQDFTDALGLMIGWSLGSFSLKDLQVDLKAAGDAVPERQREKKRKRDKGG